MRFYWFIGGDAGAWRIVKTQRIMGDPLPAAAGLQIISGTAPPAEASGAAWVVRGITSNERYSTRLEKGQLAAKQEGLGRPEATRAALIPLRKNAAWWGLTQDERRSIFEARSRHIEIGLRYLPAVARRLHHCRDLGENEPFDFITWFEYAPSHEPAFNALLAELRASEEWKYVEREMDIRLVRVSPKDLLRRRCRSASTSLHHSQGLRHLFHFKFSHSLASDINRLSISKHFFRLKNPLSEISLKRASNQNNEYQ